MITYHTAKLETKLMDPALGWNLAAVASGPEDDLVILYTNQRTDFPQLNLEINIDYERDQKARQRSLQIHHHLHGCLEIIELNNVSEEYQFIQPLNEGNWILVQSRAEYQTDENAVIYDRDGKILRKFHIGDGIVNVQTTLDHHIWVSYFDEGVFGQTIGGFGAVCFTELGVPIFKYHELVEKEERLPYIDDCYAMNVMSNEETWLYYYSDFPLVKIKKYQLESVWNDIPVKGSHQFAVSEPYVLFTESHSEKIPLLLISLESMEVTHVRPIDEDGYPIEPVYTIGRGSKLYLVSKYAIYSIDAGNVKR